jgi:hypothetical protein
MPMRKRVLFGVVGEQIPFKATTILTQTTYLPMATPLPKTNMFPEDVVPDPQRDGRYWCLPPRRDEDEVIAVSGSRYEYHLATQGRQVGVWMNWQVEFVP